MTDYIILSAFLEAFVPSNEYKKIFSEGISDEMLFSIVINSKKSMTFKRTFIKKFLYYIKDEELKKSIKGKLDIDAQVLNSFFKNTGSTTYVVSCFDGTFFFRTFEQVKDFKKNNIYGIPFKCKVEKYDSVNEGDIIHEKIMPDAEIFINERNEITLSFSSEAPVESWERSTDETMPENKYLEFPEVFKIGDIVTDDNFDTAVVAYVPENMEEKGLITFHDAAILLVYKNGSHRHVMPYLLNKAEDTKEFENVDISALLRGDQIVEEKNEENLKLEEAIKEILQFKDQKVRNAYFGTGKKVFELMYFYCLGIAKISDKIIKDSILYIEPRTENDVKVTNYDGTVTENCNKFLDTFEKNIKEKLKEIGYKSENLNNLFIK